LILLVYGIRIFSSSKNAKQSPLFRYDVNQAYQLQAYSLYHQEKVGEEILTYHNFLGSVVWSVEHNTRLLRIHIFLSNYTKKESLTLRLACLDKDYQILSSHFIEVYKWQRDFFELNLPEHTEFLQVDEVERTKPKRVGEHIYSVEARNFNKKNQILSLSKEIGTSKK
jgi:hypothetical protein